VYCVAKASVDTVTLPDECAENSQSIKPNGSRCGPHL
jgi:hypothetical protein